MAEQRAHLPFGVMAISVLYYLAAFILFITALLSFAGAVVNGIVKGVMFLIFALIALYLAQNLRHQKPWARFAVLVISVLLLLQALILLIALQDYLQLVWIVVNGAIFWYLRFHPESKATFA